VGLDAPASGLVRSSESRLRGIVSIAWTHGRRAAEAMGDGAALHARKRTRLATSGSDHAVGDNGRLWMEVLACGSREGTVAACFTAVFSCVTLQRGTHAHQVCNYVRVSRRNRHARMIDASRRSIGRRAACGATGRTRDAVPAAAPAVVCRRRRDEAGGAGSAHGHAPRLLRVRVNADIYMCV